jgi:hypothetical protein
MKIEELENLEQEDLQYAFNNSPLGPGDDDDDDLGEGLDDEDINADDYDEFDDEDDLGSDRLDNSDRDQIDSGLDEDAPDTGAL